MPTRKHLRQSTLLGFGGKAPSSTRTKTWRLNDTSPIVPKRKRPATPEYSSDSDDVRAIRFVSKTPTSGNARSAVKRRRRIQVVESNSSEDASAKSEDEPDVSKGKRRRVDSDQSDSAPRPSTSSRRIIAQRQVVSDEDLEEEVDKDSILPTRLRSRGKLTAFQKNLERLRRRKQGKRNHSTSNSEPDEESETSGSDDTKPFRGAMPHDDYGGLFSEENDDSDSSSNFIVEDDGNIPRSLPAQFSMESHQDLSYQFKKVFQFFVHIAVRPPLERHEFMSSRMKDEEYFSIPLNLLRRKIMGLRDSLVASSVWRPEFKISLERYPNFELTQLDYAVPGCDACHLGGRKSSLVGRLGGFPYDKRGFEMIVESDSECDSEKEETLEYNLGRFCGKRTRVYHELTHWEYTLFKSILQEVDDLHAAKQSKGFIRVAYDGRRRPPKDLSDADGICEWLDDRKIIDMEWQRIKDIMESARHLEMIPGKEDVD